MSAARAAKISDLCAVLSAATGIPEKTVNSYARYLRADGLLPSTVGGRGNAGGAPATAAHAAILLTALLGSDEALNAPAAVRRFGVLPFSGCVWRHVVAGADQGMVSDQWPPEGDYRRAPFVRVLEASIALYQRGREKSLNAPLTKIGIFRSCEQEGFVLEYVIPQNICGGVGFAYVMYLDQRGHARASAPFAVQKTCEIAADVLSVIAETLGRVPALEADVGLTLAPAAARREGMS